MYFLAVAYDVDCYSFKIKQDAMVIQIGFGVVQKFYYVVLYLVKTLFLLIIHQKLSYCELLCSCLFLLFQVSLFSLDQKEVIYLMTCNFILKFSLNNISVDSTINVPYVSVYKLNNIYLDLRIT